MHENINKLTSESIELLRKIVSIPSFSSEEENVRDFIASQLENWGIEYCLERNNIIVYNNSFDQSKETLMLCAHIDTVLDRSDFERNPYDSGNDPEIIYGLGSNDDGGSVVSLIAVLRYFIARTDLNFNIMLVLNAEEETSGDFGMRWLMDKKCPIPKPNFAIIGEPTSMKVATSERGLLVIDAYAHGICGHAARADGVNALYIAINDINELLNYKFTKVSSLMGNVIMTVNQIEGGCAHNITPDKCHYVIDIRLTDQYKQEEIVKSLQLLCNSKLIKREFSRDAHITNVDGLLHKTISNLKFDMFSSSTTSDWMEVKCDAIKIGPGDSMRSHSKNEYILTSEIKEGVYKYIEIIEELNRLYK